MFKPCSKRRLRALETLRVKGKHKTHRHWVRKIDKKWALLNELRWSEAVCIMDQIRESRKCVEELGRENLFELDCNCNEQKVLLNFTNGRTRNEFL